MAVVQISRIQVRRGQANGGTGFPQLASGELGWAIDTQQLFIGNGSVSEGAPNVGNTKILTQQDLTGTSNLLQQVQHIYRVADTTIQTGVTPNSPVTRILQDRLDDTVSVKDFGAVGDGATDDTAAIQRAIDQLFLNPTTPAYANTTAGATKRVTLVFPAGIFVTSKTLFVPSYATIQGAGKDKTTIEYDPSITITGSINNAGHILLTTSAAASMIGATVIAANLPTNSIVTSVTPGVSITVSTTATADGIGTSYQLVPANPAIRIVNNNSTPGTPSVIGSTNGTNQPRKIEISNLSISTPSGVNTALQLDAIRDSKFSDIGLNGNWSNNFSESSTGILMQALSSIITCENNLLENFTISGFTYAVYANQDIKNNSFINGHVTECYQGHVFGLTADAYSVGQQYGPRESVIDNIKYYRIKRHAIYIGLGSGNTSKNNKFINVGCDDAGNATGAAYPQVYFKVPGNTSFNDYSDRFGDLSKTDANLTTKYIAEVAGHATYELQGIRQAVISYVTTNLTPAFRLPVSTTATGVSQGSINFSIKYFYKSNTNSFTREGIIRISADIDHGKIQLTDDYEYAGADVAEAAALGLNFSASFLDELGVAYTGAPGQVPGSIMLFYTNTLINDTGYLTYSITTSL